MNPAHEAVKVHPHLLREGQAVGNCRPGRSCRALPRPRGRDRSPAPTSAAQPREPAEHAAVLADGGATRRWYRSCSSVTACSWAGSWEKSSAAGRPGSAARVGIERASSLIYRCARQAVPGMTRPGFARAKRQPTGRGGWQRRRQFGPRADSRAPMGLYLRLAKIAFKRTRLWLRITT